MDCRSEEERTSKRLRKMRNDRPTPSDCTPETNFTTRAGLAGAVSHRTGVGPSCIGTHANLRRPAAREVLLHVRHIRPDWEVDKSCTNRKWLTIVDRSWAHEKSRLNVERRCRRVKT